MQHSRILLLMTIQCLYFANAVRQRCYSPRFSCQYNNPCLPICDEGQFYYPGRSDSIYVQCAEGECTEQRCPRRTTWNQESGRCEHNGVEFRCAFPTFDCADHNPCESTLCEQGVNNYPGPSLNRYVSCGDGCSEEQCERGKIWDQDAQKCRSRNRPCTQRDLILYVDEYSYGGDQVSYRTRDQCTDGCLADVDCYGVDWNFAYNACYFHNSKSNLEIRHVSQGICQLVKPPVCV